MPRYEQENVDQETLQAALDDGGGEKITDKFVNTQRRICRKARGAETGFVTTRYGKIAQVEHLGNRKKQ